MNRILPMLRKAVICLLLVAVLGINSGTASAQETNGLAVSPPAFELSANPGDTLTNSIRVDNLSPGSQEVSVSTRNFTALGEDGQVSLNEEGDNPYSLASWITVDPALTVIPTKESKVFNYTITVPADAQPGGRFGSIVFKTAIKPLAGQSGVAVGQEIGTLIFVKIAGAISEKGSVASFNAAKSFYETGPITFDIRMKNEGNVFFRPTGTITIADFRGRKVKDIPVDARNVLPGAIRKMNGELKNKWLFGRYTATVTLVYGSTNQFKTASTTFWAIPYRLIIGVLILLGGAGYLLYRGRHRIKRAIEALKEK